MSGWYWRLQFEMDLLIGCKWRAKTWVVTKFFVNMFFFLQWMFYDSFPHIWASALCFHFQKPQNVTAPTAAAIERKKYIRKKLAFFYGSQKNSEHCLWISKIKMCEAKASTANGCDGTKWPDLMWKMCNIPWALFSYSRGITSICLRVHLRCFAHLIEIVTWFDFTGICET